MYIKKVELENFRNYSEISMEFDKKLNIIIGENAQGKTNLIESIYISSMGKSFRTSKDRELINFSSDLCRIKTEYFKDGDDCTIEISVNSEGKKGIKVDGASIKKISQLMENLLAVIFSPDDLKIIKEEPARRRNFMDRELCQLKVSYFNNLSSYKKVLTHRNNLLKERDIDRNLLGVYDSSLAAYGSRIIRERIEFARKLNVISRNIHNEITNGRENIDIRYISDIPADDDVAAVERNMLNALEKSRENDIRKRTTSRGPHKDDLRVMINNIDARKFGSQGQQRTAALSLKLAEISLIEEEMGESPVLLLDDVMSELDSERQRFLIESLGNVQIFITTTELSDEVREKLKGGKIIKIRKGKEISE